MDGAAVGRAIWRGEAQLAAQGLLNKVLSTITQGGRTEATFVGDISYNTKITLGKSAKMKKIF